MLTLESYGCIPKSLILILRITAHHNFFKKKSFCSVITFCWLIDSAVNIIQKVTIVPLLLNAATGYEGNISYLFFTRAVLIDPKLQTFSKWNSRWKMLQLKKGAVQKAKAVMATSRSRSLMALQESAENRGW